MRCNDCGLVYQNPRLSENEIGSYYPAEYDPFVPPPWTQRNPVTRLVQLYGYRKRWSMVERWAPQRTGRRSVLDVGCATGLFLATGNDEWYKTGIELTEAAAHAACTSFGLRVHQGTLESVELPDGSFDAITMWDVVEHLHSPTASLRRVRQLLRPDGVFVLRVPNLDAWDARLFGRYWAGLDQPRHLFVPDEDTLGQLLARSGFAEVERVCLSGAYGVLVLSCRFWLGDRLESEQWRRRALKVVDNFGVRLALSPLLWLIDKVARKGPLLTVVARPLPE